jgi:hypothetical protein
MQKSDWRNKWAREAQTVRESTNQRSNSILRQQELPKGDTAVRFLTYEPPLPKWTHWVNEIPYSCEGDNETLMTSGGIDENCRVCQFVLEQGIEEVSAASQRWLIPISINDEGGKKQFRILEITKQLYIDFAKIAMNSRNDICAADIIISKAVRNKRTEYSAVIADDSPMTEQEEKWMEDAYQKAEECLIPLTEERIATLIGEAPPEPEPEPPKRTVVRPPVGTKPRIGLGR